MGGCVHCVTNSSLLCFDVTGVDGRLGDPEAGVLPLPGVPLVPFNFVLFPLFGAGEVDDFLPDC